MTAPDDGEDTAEIPVFAPYWSVPDTRPVTYEAAVNRLDYHIDQLEVAGDRMRHATYAVYQAVTRFQADPRRRHRQQRRFAAMFAAAIAGGATGTWLWAAATVTLLAGDL